MTEFYYSPTKNAFYCELHQEQYALAGTWPADAVAVDESVYTEFATTTATAGKMRVAGTDGMPAWGDIPAPTKEELIASAGKEKELRISEASAKISPLQDAVDLGMATDEEVVQLTEWKKYRVLLNRVDISEAPDINWPDAPV
ncbi:tail fiber assembly protein [Citrobacter freundii]|uniref:tail fiber assembly protein n=1 Tax=Citrobacter freundii TaxID=546 RepID=UPI0030D17AF7